MNNSVQMAKGPTYDYIRPWLGDGLLTSTGKAPTFHNNALFANTKFDRGKMA